MRKAMERADRAKQFMPFAALKGYEESLREMERVSVSRVVLGEDAQYELDMKLRSLVKGRRLTALYYLNGEYVKVSGALTHIDELRRLLIIGDRKIPIDDLLDIDEAATF